MDSPNKNTTAPALEPLLTRGELQAVLRLSGRTVARLVTAGGLPAPIRVGKSYRWRTGDIDRFIREQGGQQTEK